MLKTFLKRAEETPSRLPINVFASSECLVFLFSTFTTNIGMKWGGKISNFQCLIGNETG